MELDILTLIFIIGIAHLMQVVVFFYQYLVSKNILGTGWWLLWSGSEFIGFSLILLRSNLSLLPFVIVFQNIIMLSGTIFIYIGVLRFFDKKINFRFIVPFFITFVFLHLYFFLIKDDMGVRSFIMDVALAIVAVVTAASLFKNKYKSIATTVNFNAAILLVHASIFAYRAVLFITGVSLNDMFAHTGNNYIQYFDALVVGLLWTFGFIIMINQKLNAETNEAKAHFEEIFNTSPDAAAINRVSDGKYVNYNENYLKISGYTKDDIEGKSSIDINIWESLDERNEVVRLIEEKGYCDNHEILFRRKNGEVLTGLISAKLIDLKGVPHIMSVTRDITMRKKADQEITLKNIELQKLNSEKDKFFSIIAHDLKTPFNSIVGFSELLVEKAKEKDLDGIEEYTGIILKSSYRVLDLLMNLMEWSRSQTGRLIFNPKPTDLTKLIDEDILLFIAIADQKNIKITKELPHSLLLEVDHEMINTVLRNLISNAIKFTFPGGNINVAATKNGKGVTVSINDSGIGIPKSAIHKLFRIDENYSTRGTQNEQGTGLGLILCKEFVEKHGGSIKVESEPGQGSTFSFTLSNHSGL